MLPFEIKKGANNLPVDVTPFSDTVYHLLLTPSTNKVVAVPAGARVALINYDANTWVRINAVAVVPVSDVVDGMGSDLNPSAKYLDGVTTINFISPSPAKISIAWFK